MCTCLPHLESQQVGPEAAQATHHYDKGTHEAEALPSSMSKEPIIIEISDNEE